MPFSPYTVRPPPLHPTLPTFAAVSLQGNDADALFASSHLVAMSRCVQMLGELAGGACEVFGEIQKGFEQQTERITRIEARLLAIKRQLPSLPNLIESAAAAPPVDRQEFKSKPQVLAPTMFATTARNTSVAAAYEAANPPPELSLLDEFRPDGKPCMRFYSDPQFFVDTWMASIQEETTARRIKKNVKKGARSTGTMLRNKAPSAVNVKRYTAYGELIHTDLSPLSKAPSSSSLVTSEETTQQILSDESLTQPPHIHQDREKQSSTEESMKDESQTETTSRSGSQSGLSFKELLASKADRLSRASFDGARVDPRLATLKRVRERENQADPKSAETPPDLQAAKSGDFHELDALMDNLQLDRGRSVEIPPLLSQLKPHIQLPEPTDMQRTDTLTKSAPPKPAKPRSLSPTSKLDNRLSLMTDGSTTPRTPTTPSRPASNLFSLPVSPPSPSNVLFTPVEDQPVPPPPPPPPAPPQMFDDIPLAPMIPVFAGDKDGTNVARSPLEPKKKGMVGNGPSARDAMLNSIKGGMVSLKKVTPEVKSAPADVAPAGNPAGVAITALLMRRAALEGSDDEEEEEGDDWD